MTLHDTFRALLGADVAYALRTPGEVSLDALHPVEAEAVQRAIPKRRAQMAAGRDAARAALAQLGIGNVAIPRSAGGDPVWPDGIVGSITHTDELCIAAVARRDRLAGIGIDAEPEGRIEEELWASIATADEQAELGALDAASAGARAQQIFCAKEAAYKCQYPLSGLLLDFGDLKIRWLGVRGHVQDFEATYQRDAGPFQRGDRISGIVAQAAGHVVAVAEVTTAWISQTRRGAP